MSPMSSKALQKCPRALEFALMVVLATRLTFSASLGSEERPYLATAVKAARWIKTAAINSPKGLSWPAVPPDASTVQTNLYSGTPGVVLFLLEMHRATGDPQYLNDAQKGADFLLASLPSQQQAGFYTGLSGVAYVIAETAKLSGKPEYREGFKACLKQLRYQAVKAGKGIEWSPVTDLIDGSAGIGLFLLYAADELNDPGLLQPASQAGDRLLEKALKEADGLKWAMSPDFPRLMPNFSHGTAGVAYFLASLYQKTQKKEYLDAALAGAKYLLSVAKTDGDGCLIFHDEPDGRDLYYLGWCHGPTGTARLFYLLDEITGDKTWMDWVKRSARSLLESGIPEKQTPGFWNNVSVCCGSAGIADFFLNVFKLTGDKIYLDFCLRITKDLLSKATEEKGNLKWIQAEHRVRPEFLQAQTGLMQGAAGIGLWLLNLDGYYQKRKPGFVFPDSPFGR